MRSLTILLLLLAATRAAHAQSLTWVTHGTLYGDNTEFFTPYRVGETILGGTIRSYLRMHTGERTRLHAGLIADHRSGSDRFAHPLRPVLAFRYETPAATVTVGSIFPERRHGFIEPLLASTYEITRPIEYGGQVQAGDSARRWWSAETFINWQRLNLASQREVFDYGGVAWVQPVRVLRVEAQMHGVHQGGQLHDAGQPVTNNVTTALGVTLADTIGPLSRVSLTAFRAWNEGSGTYLRAGVTPFGWVELYGIWWRGDDFVSQEGDNNYNSTGHTPPFYQSNREYLEIGLLRRTRIEQNVTLDAEIRVHQFDGGIRSVSLFDSRWEYSYRFIVRAPFELVLR